MKAHFPTNLASGTAVIVAAFLAVGCGENPDQVGWWQGEQQRIELSQQLELKQFRYDQGDSRDFEQLEKLHHSSALAAAALKSLHQQRLALGDEVDSLEGQWAEFRESTIRGQRQVAMGQTFENLTSATGRTFVAVTVAAIDDAGVTIRHADGSARLRFADLSASQRVFFALEADLALAAEDKETQDAADYEQWVRTRMVAIEEKKQQDSESAKRDALANQRTRAALATQLASASASRTLARPTSDVGNRSWSYSDSYSSHRSYRPTYRYVYYDHTPHYGCGPALNVYPRRHVSPYSYTSAVVHKRKSFADTTIPSIP